MFEDPTVFFSMDFFLSLFSFFTASTLKNNPVLYIYICATVLVHAIGRTSKTILLEIRSALHFTII